MLAIILAILLWSVRIDYLNKKIPSVIVVDSIVFRIPDQTIEWLYALRQCEASGRYKATNGTYDGGYQIGKQSKQTVGFSILSTKQGREIFLKDSLLQEEVMLRLLQSNINMMYYYIKNYSNKSIGNYWITSSGILAMAHLGGVDNTIKFLTSNGTKIFVDGNGVPITRYLQFNKYNVPIDSVITPHYITKHLMKYLKK